MKPSIQFFAFFAFYYFARRTALGRGVFRHSFQSIPRILALLKREKLKKLARMSLWFLYDTMQSFVVLKRQSKTIQPLTNSIASRESCEGTTMDGGSTCRSFRRFIRNFVGRKNRAQTHVLYIEKGLLHKRSEIKYKVRQMFTYKKHFLLRI